jgi:hypothetical protein
MRKYLIGVITCLVGAITFSGVASADVTNLTIQSSITPTKAPKKKFVGASVFFRSADTHAGALPCPLGTAGSPTCYAFPPSTNSLITFPKGLKFTPGNLPDCNLSVLSGKSTAQARAACPKSIIATGSNVQAFSDGRTLNGVVTAFNGAPSGGNPSQYLHVEFPGVATKPILQGTVRGNTIQFIVPPVPGSVIENIGVTFPKKVVGKKRNKSTGKVEKTFYASFRCASQRYTITEVNTYANGKVLTATTPDTCKQTK